MKNIFRKAAALLTAAVVSISSLTFAVSADDSRQKLPESEAMRFVDSMGAGWNLGNGFDATNCSWVKNELDYESAWCGAKATKALIKTVKDAGFSTIRIPVSWHDHVDKDFNISDVWMKRVKEVVDWSLAEGLYVILNTHHDIAKGAVYPSSAEKDTSIKYIKKVWEQIGNTFRNYDNKLIFETLNEPRLTETNYEWWYDVNNVPADVVTALELINTYNQTAVDTIRATGGNNKDRYILAGGYATGNSNLGILSKYFRMPTDSVKNRLIADVHYYGIGAKSSLQALEDIYKQFTAKGIPVVLTEYGLRADGYNYTDKADIAVKRMTEFVSYARNRGMSVVIWDNNYGGKGIDNGHKFIDRASAKVITPDVVAAVVKSGAPALKTGTASSAPAEEKSSGNDTSAGSQTSSSYKTVKNTKGTIAVTAKVYTNKAKFTWKAVEGATKYAIYQYKDGAYRPLSKKLTKTSVTVKGLKSGTEYGFIVRAYVNGKWTSAKTKDIISFTTL